MLIVLSVAKVLLLANLYIKHEKDSLYRIPRAFSSLSAFTDSVQLAQC